MGQVLICAPNYVDDTVEPPVVGGGDWENASPISNINAEFYIENSTSIDATTSKTKFEVDFTFVRDLKFIGIPDSNITNVGKIRVIGSTVTAWTGATVNGVNIINATTLTISTSTAVTISAGEIFKIAGDATVYQVVTGATIGASSTGSITIKRDGITGTGLTVATTGAEVITCHSGDYTTTIFDTGLIDYFKPSIPFGSVPWGAAGLWDGKQPDSFYTKNNFPRSFEHIFTASQNVRYVLVELDNTTNAAGNVSIDALYLTSVFRPKNGMLFGATFGSRSNTTKEKSAGGAVAFNKERQERFINFQLADISVTDAFSTLEDITRQLDISGNLYFIYDESDTTLLSRRSFAGRFEELPNLSHDFFDGISVPINIIERLA